MVTILIGFACACLGGVVGFVLCVACTSSRIDDARADVAARFRATCEKCRDELAACNESWDDGEVR
jgi:hypothetical protein